MKREFRNYREKEYEKERKVTYDSYVDGQCRAYVTVHIPKRSPEEQAEYEKTVRAALRRYYYHVTVEQGQDWDKLAAKSKYNDIEIIRAED